MSITLSKSPEDRFCRVEAHMPVLKQEILNVFTLACCKTMKTNKTVWMCRLILSMVTCAVSTISQLMYLSFNRVHTGKYK